MNQQPAVCAVCITADRPELTRKAVECFRAQSYENKRMFVFDTSAREDPESGAMWWVGIPDVDYMWMDPEFAPKTIGALRNMANSEAVMDRNADILTHFDSDDWSCASRISEQVAFLQQSGAGCVGYDKMLFWREPGEVDCQSVDYHTGQAWLYLGHPWGDRYALGASLCYWRSVWERRPFDNAKHVGEDKDWIRGVDTRSISSLGRFIRLGEMDHTDEPRLIARIHGSNTGNYDPEMMKSHPAHWKRAPEFDAVCRKAMG